MLFATNSLGVIIPTNARNPGNFIVPYGPASPDAYNQAHVGYEHGLGIHEIQQISGLGVTEPIYKNPIVWYLAGLGVVGTFLYFRGKRRANTPWHQRKMTRSERRDMPF